MSLAAQAAPLFVKVANDYLRIRPTYPPQLFQFIGSKTTCHDLVWDVGTGSGQAIPHLAKIYKKVIGTDIGRKQLQLAPTLQNVHYVLTPTEMTIPELESHVAPQSSVDLVTVAQALHWLDLPSFYEQARWVLKKPDGVLAAWCYNIPSVGPAVDAIFGRMYAVDLGPYWEEGRVMVDRRYGGMEFPFGPVEGLGSSTGPFEFYAEKEVDFEGFLQFIRTLSAYNAAQERGVELLREDMVERLEKAWEEDGGGVKVARFPIYLRIGRVGDYYN